MSWRDFIARFLADESGGPAIEYSFVAGMMVVVVVGIAAVGGALDGLYDRVALIVTAMGG